MIQNNNRDNQQNNLKPIKINFKNSRRHPLKLPLYSGLLETFLGGREECQTDLEGSRGGGERKGAFNQKPGGTSLQGAEAWRVLHQQKWQWCAQNNKKILPLYCH